MRILTALFVISVLCRAAMGELRWEKQELRLQAEADQQQVVGEFPFENTGPLPVSIAAIESSCGCTIATLEKQRYAPGEKGVLRATFTVGGRTGVQSKVITVKTDRPEDVPMRLVMTVELVDPPTIAPRLLYWLWGERKKAKALLVKAPEGRRCQVTAITIDGESFSAEMTTVEAGKEYRIMVTPRDTREAVNAVLEVQTDWPPKSPRSYKVFLRVLPKNAKDAASGGG